MADLVKSVEFFEIDTTGTTMSYDLTKGQDWTNCVPFFSNHGAQDYTDVRCWDCSISGTTSGTITFTRANDRSTSGYVKCFVVEFDPDEVYVEQGSFDCSSVGTDSVTTNTSFNPERTGMVHYWQSSNGSPAYWARVLCRGRVVSPGNLDFYRHDTGSNLHGHWFIFEAKHDQFIVDHSISTAGGGSNIQLSKSYDPLKTFIIGSYASSCIYSYADCTICRPYIFQRGLARWDRSNGSYTSYVAIQVIEFQDNKIHVPVSWLLTLDSTAYTFNWNDPNAVNVPVNLDTSIIVKSAPYFDRCDTESTNGIDGLSSSVKFDNEYQVSFQKNSQTNNTYPVFSVVDWIGTSIDIGTNNAPLDPTKSFVKSVENVRIGVEYRQGAVPLTKGQNINNCVVFASQYATSAEQIPRAYMHDVFLSDTNMVCAHRISDSGVGYVDASVVEFYPDQVKVYSGALNSPDMTTEVEVTVSGMNMSRSFLLAKSNTTTGSTGWSYAMLRSRIIDDGKIGFYKYSSISSTQVSWFVAEDITQDNTCFDVVHWNQNTGYTVYYVAENEYYPYTNTFLLSSAASSSIYQYIDCSCFRNYFKNTGKPQQIEIQNSNYTKYYAGQIVRIRRSGRLHTQTYVPTMSSPSMTIDYPTSWSGSSDITVYNNTDASFCKINTESNYFSSVFVTTNISSVIPNTITIERSGSSATAYPSIGAICWAGTDIDDGAYDYATPTKSLVRSVSKRTITNNSSDKVWFWLQEGQNPKNCVPFATWSAISTDYHMDRCLKLFKIEYDFGPPYKLMIQKGASEQSPGGTTNVYIVEFDDRQVKVQSGISSFISTDVSVTIDEVDRSKSFLLFYSFTDGWNRNWKTCNVSGVIEDSTTIRFRRQDNTGVMSVAWYVVECLDDQWEVQHLYSAPNAGGNNYYNTMDRRVGLNHSWIFNSYSGGTVYQYIDCGCCRTIVATDSISTQIYRYNRNYSIYDFSSQVVEFNKDLGIRVFWDTASVSSSDTSAILDDFNTSEPLDEFRTIVFNASANNMGNGNSENTSAISQVWMVQDIVNFGDPHAQLQVSKTSTNVSTFSNSCVTEFPEFNKYYFEGYTKEESKPVSRDVFLYRSDTGDLMDITTSVSGTGYFYLETTYSGTHHVVCADDDLGITYNDLIYSKVYPTVISGTFAYNRNLTASGIEEGYPIDPTV